jgi:hypothetical protein
MERLNKVRTDPQQELIGRYCEEVRKLLDNASSREEALAIKARVCSQLARECESPLILDATRSYVDRVILNMWEEPNRGNTSL